MSPPTPAIIVAPILLLVVVAEVAGNVAFPNRLPLSLGTLFLVLVWAYWLRSSEEEEGTYVSTRGRLRLLLLPPVLLPDGFVGGAREGSEMLPHAPVLLRMSVSAPMPVVKKIDRPFHRV